MVDSRHVGTTLVLLKSILPAAVAQAISDIETELTISMEKVVKTEVRRDLRKLGDLPHTAIYLDGQSIEDDWMTPQRDTKIPLALAVTHHIKDTPDPADEYSYYYCRALDLAMNRLFWAGSITGVFKLETLTTDIEQPGNDRNRRRAFWYGTLWLRTDKGI